MLERRKLSATGKEIRKERDEKLEEFRHCASLVSKEKLARIAQADIGQLVALLRRQSISAEEAVRYYISASIACNDQLGCLADVLFEQALKRAKALDRAAENPDTRASLMEEKPLFGVPFSVKDSIDVCHALTTLGTVKRGNRGPAKSTAVLVRLLERKGAIVIAKTNVPQTLLSFESSNPLWLQTRNAWAADRSCGGSSGGEAALIAGGGSLLGIGTDIGGSLRLPAAYNGLVSLKPGSRRISRVGAVSAVRGQTAVAASLGLISQSTLAQVLVMRAWCSQEAAALDRLMPSTPLRQDVIERYANPKLSLSGDAGGATSDGITVTYFLEDDWFPSCEASKRAVSEVASLLGQVEGVRVVRAQPPSLLRLIPLYYELISAGAGPQLLQELANEEPEAFLKPTLRLNQLPGALRSVLAGLLRLVGQNKKAAVVAALGAKSAAKLFELVAEQQDLIRIWLNHFDAIGADILLCPATALPPIKHQASSQLTPSLSYTMLYNLLDFPSGVVPVTKVSTEDLEKDCHRPRGWRKAVEETEQGSEGLPIGVQIVALPHGEERVLGMMHLVEELLREKSKKSSDEAGVDGWVSPTMQTTRSTVIAMGKE